MLCKLVCTRLAKGLADRLPAPQSGSEHNRTESVGALIGAIRQEEAKVHLDLPALLKVCALVFPLWVHACMPFVSGDQLGHVESKVFPTL